MAAAGIEHDMLDYPQESIQVTSSSSDRDATCSLPAGWKPVQNDRAVSPVLVSASSGRAFIAAKAA
jgi:hypothetical protein